MFQYRFLSCTLDYNHDARRLSHTYNLQFRYPLDVIKTRIQLQTGTAAAGSEAYTGMLDCFQKIVKTEG
jgi:solute carrier family 25 2-oxodicarboxylate transporter 21